MFLKRLCTSIDKLELAKFHYAFRSSERHEHVQMECRDIQLKSDAEGTEYLESNENTTKTGQESHRGCPLFAPKMFAAGKCMKINAIMI